MIFLFLFAFVITWRYNTKFHDPNKRKTILPCFEWTWLLYKNIMVYRVFIFIFCLEPTLGKDTWMRATSTNVMVIFSKMPSWKLLGHNCIQSSFSTISRFIDNSILKDTLQLNILRTWIEICTNLFIKAWVNIIKRRSTKVPWKLSLAKKKK